jgi:hypothetical protein
MVAIMRRELQTGDFEEWGPRGEVDEAVAEGGE